MKKVLFLVLIVITNYSFAQSIKDTVVTADNIILETATGKLYGSLTVPTVNKTMPVLLIIAGSGPTDRNGNTGKALTANSYKILADSLLKYGIASLRFDKRGAGKSIGAVKSITDFRFKNYIDDATDWIKLLQKDVRFSKVIVAGHSEGSLVGMIAAKNAKANKYISLAGAGFPIQMVLKKQFSAQPEAYREALLTRLDTLISGKLLTNVPKEFYSIFSPTLQPYLMNWFTYEPALEIAKLTIPVLILNGTTDIQVGVEQAENLHKFCKQSKLVLIKGMSHVLKEGAEDRNKNAATYNSIPNEPIKNELVQAIVKFIKEK